MEERIFDDWMARLGGPDVRVPPSGVSLVHPDFQVHA